MLGIGYTHRHSTFLYLIVLTNSTFNLIFLFVVLSVLDQLAKELLGSRSGLGKLLRELLIGELLLVHLTLAISSASILIWCCINQFFVN